MITAFRLPAAFAQIFVAWQWKRLRRLKYVTDEAKLKVLIAKTVMINHFPKDIVTDRAFFAEMQSILPGWVRGKT